MPLKFIDEHKSKNLVKNRKFILIKMLILSGGPFLLFFGLHHTLTGSRVEGIIGLAGGMAMAVLYIVLERNRNWVIISRALLVLTGFILLYFLLNAEGNPDKALWCYIYPLIALFMLGKQEGLIWAVAFYLLVAGILTVPCFFFVDGIFASELRVRFLVTLGIVLAMAFIFEEVRHKTEQEMASKQQSLERSEARYRSAYTKLNEMNSQLVQSAKLASIGELASGVAHELNQPLMVVRGMAQLIRRNLRKNNLNNAEPAEPAELMKQLDPIEKNTKRMMNIIDHLRTFSRQSKGEFRRLDMNRIVKGSFTLINEQLRLHDIEVVEVYASDLPPIQGDETQIEQVIINLIANARDAITSIAECGMRNAEYRGKIEIITAIGKPQSKIDMGFIEVLFKDNGGGIPAEHLEKIFDPFFTTKEVGKGTGLGLSISYGIIKEHGGEIEVVETGPDGTTFRIRVPIGDC